MGVSGSAARVYMGNGGSTSWPGTPSARMHVCLSVRICAVSWVNVSTEEGEGRVDSVGVPLQQAFACRFMCEWRVCVSVNA